MEHGGNGRGNKPLVGILVAVVFAGVALTGFTNALVGIAVALVGAAALIFFWTHGQHATEALIAPAPATPTADIQILSLKETGGSSSVVDFSAEVANYGDRQARAAFSAHVGSTEVECYPGCLDLIPNRPPERVHVRVPRPDLGELVPEFANQTTLYGRTLTFEASTADQPAVTREWDEIIYKPEDNRTRYEAQQRIWRIGRGTATDYDIAADERRKRLDQWHERREQEGHEYDS